MRIVVDGLGAAPGSSAAVILEHFVNGWASLGDDEVFVSVSPEVAERSEWDPSLHIEKVPYQGAAGRVRAQLTQLPRLCRRVGADAMVGLLSSTTLAPLRCPRVVLLFDVRYEVLPDQFSWKTRLLRKVSYGIGWRQADAIACISGRTRADLVGPRPWLKKRLVGVAPLGADHVAGWPVVHEGAPYAVAFGQYGHKNVDMVMDAWGLLRDRGVAMPIKLIGMPDDARHAAQAHIDRLSLTDLVTPVGWLFGDDLRRCFASAGLFVFPSDFEGFGLPAVEAMQLGIPLVISPDRALLEITDGHATVMERWDAAALADAAERALASSPESLDAARAQARRYTWSGMAKAVRAMVEEVQASRRR